MPVKVVAAPVEPVVSLEEAKQQLGILDNGDRDQQITALIKAVTRKLDAPDGFLGRSLVTRTYELTEIVDSVGPVLLYPPFIDIVSVDYDLGAGPVAVADTDYALTDGAFVYPVGFSLGSRATIQYRAGYGGAEDVPEEIRQAILIGVQMLFDQTGGDITTNAAVRSLLAEYRLWY